MARKFVLTTPGRIYHAGVRYSSRWGVMYFEGEALPGRLAEYEAKPHSWEAYVERVINGEMYPPKRRIKPQAPYPYQQDKINDIVKSVNLGSPGYVLAWPTGSGKTLTAINTVNRCAPKRVLVLTRVSTIPPWRKAINVNGLPSIEWVITNPERMRSLFGHHNIDIQSMPARRAGEVAALSGDPLADFDFVIADESHMLAHATSLRSRLMRRLLDRTQETSRKRPFSLYMSATPFTSPGEASYLMDLLAFATGSHAPEDPNDFEQWLRIRGLQLNNDEKGIWYHKINPGDVRFIETILYNSGVGSRATAEDLGLPTQVRELVPIEMSPADRAEYEKLWEDFRAERGMEASRFRDDNEVALRKIQKASLLKARYVAVIAADLVESGNQVVIPAWFTETIHAIAVETSKELARRGLNDRVVEITGSDRALREEKRRAFQDGRALVITLNSLEGIDLHAGEKNVDGNGKPGTTTPRVCLVADVLTGGKRALQAEGRTARDGQSSLAMYVYAEGTAEEAWMAQMYKQLSNTSALLKSPNDTITFTELAEELERSVNLREEAA